MPMNCKISAHLSGVSQEIWENGAVVLNCDILAQTERKGTISDISENIHGRNYGIVIGSHLLWLWSCSWLYRSFVCCCVDISTLEGCDAATHALINIRITITVNFILIFDIFVVS